MRYSLKGERAKQRRDDRVVVAPLFAAVCGYSEVIRLPSIESTTGAAAHLHHG